MITIFFLINFLLNSDIFINTIFNSVHLWFNNLFPNLFIFFTICDILNNYQFPTYLNQFSSTLAKKLFKLPKEASYILFMSIISGFPGNSKLIKNELDKKSINEYDANKLLTMTHVFNPLFIINIIGIKYLKDIKLGIIILFSHILTNYLVGFLFRNIYIVDTKKIITKKENIESFMTVLKTSFMNTFKILVNVLGIIIFFSIITTMINQYLNLNPYSNMFINSLLEITNGLNLLNNLHLSKIKNATLITFFISFGGLSIHMQIMSILNNYKISYLIYLVSRLLHAAISSLIVFIILINY